MDHPSPHSAAEAADPRMLFGWRVVDEAGALINEGYCTSYLEALAAAWAARDADAVRSPAGIAALPVRPERPSRADRRRAIRTQR